MNKLLNLILLSTLFACGHVKKAKSPKDSYSPVVSFSEADKTFTSEVKLPKSCKEPLPLVVIVHEWWGRNEYILKRSQMLNEEGYATLAVDLFGDGKTVETPSEAQALATPFYQDPDIGVKRLSKYIELASKDPHIDQNKIFVIGYCFGGTQALNLARSGEDIKGVVSFHGGLASSLKSTGLKTKVLALNGLSDPMVSSKEREGFKKEMKELKARHKIVNYKGATHAFTNPKATEIGKKFKIPIAYNQKADRDSWKELLIFLKD
jgi:dienelactone hydrolase